MTATSLPVSARSDGLAESMRRRLGPASVEGALGIRVIAAESRRVELELPLPLRCGSSAVAGPALESALAVLCDCGLGLALMARRGDGDGGITLDLRVDAVAEIRPHTTYLRVVAEGVGVGDEHGCGRVDVFDDRGRLVAHAAGAMAMSPSLPIMERDPAVAEPRRLDLGTLFDGLELTDGGADIPVRLEAENSRGIVHGALLAAAALAVSRAGGSEGRLISFSAEFLRPVPADVGILRARVTPVRRGRRFLSDRIELLLPDGRTAAGVTTVFARV